MESKRAEKMVVELKRHKQFEQRKKVRRLKKLERTEGEEKKNLKIHILLYEEKSLTDLSETSVTHLTENSKPGITN